MTKRTEVPVKELIIFYLLACLFSWPFFLWSRLAPDSWQAIPIPDYLLPSLFMWGPGLAALVCSLSFPKQKARLISFFGKSVFFSLLFFFPPMILMSLVYASQMGLKAAFFFLFSVSTLGVFNVLGEELGWRWFLQEKLRPLPFFKRYFLIGLAWEFWHLRFFPFSTQEGLAILIVVAFSFLIGTATERSRSLIVAITLHLWINVLWEEWTFLFSQPVKIMLLITVITLYWLGLLWRWPQNTPPTKKGIHF